MTNTSWQTVNKSMQVINIKVCDKFYINHMGLARMTVCVCHLHIQVQPSLRWMCDVTPELDILFAKVLHIFVTEGQTEGQIEGQTEGPR